jgi:chitinase
LLSIAVPGLQRDMIAFTNNTGPKIWNSVDFVNVMSYDLMNRRDNVTKHHTDVAGSLTSVQNYMNIGLKPEKVNLGFAMYAKWFKASGCSLEKALGCPAGPFEDAQGQDTGTSGAVVFDGSGNIPDASQSKTDTTAGGQYYFDSATSYFWTFETPALVQTKFDKIVNQNGLGGAMIWSLGEDGKDFALLKAVSAGVAGMKSVKRSGYPGPSRVMRKL